MSLKDSVAGITKVWKAQKVLEPYYRGGKAEISEISNQLVTELDGKVKLVQWDSQSNVESLIPEDDDVEQQSVATFCLSPNGKEIVVATTRFSIVHWHIGSKESQRSIKAHRMPILAMDFDPTSTLVATGSADRTVKVWDILKGYCTHSFSNHSDIVKVVRFHHDADKLTLFSSSDDNSICMYDLRKSECIAQFRDHVSLPSSLALTADGGILVSSGRDKVLNCYDLRSHSLLKTVPIMEELESVVTLNPEISRAIVLGCGISLKKQTSLVSVIVTGGDKGVLQFSVLTMAGHDLSTFTFTYLFQIPLSAAHSSTVLPEDVAKLKSISRLLYLPKAKEIVAFTNDFNICVYDLTAITAQAAAFVDNSRSWLSPSRVLIGSHGDILDMVRVPNSAYDVALVTNSPQLRFMNRQFECQVLEGHQDIILTIDISDDGKWIVTGSKDKTCRVWNTAALATGDVQKACVAIAQGHTEPVGAVAIAHNPATYLSHNAFIVSGAGDKILKRWSLPVHLVEKSSTSSSSSGQQSEYVMPLSPSHSLRAHEKDINCLAVSPNDQLVASASQDKTIKLWSAQDLSTVATLSGHKRGVWKVRFSPVDKVLLSCSGDRTVKLWSLQDFSIIRTLEGHTASVLNAIFINHATQIVSSSADGLLRLWTIRSGECLRTMEEHEDRVWALQSLPLTEDEKRAQETLVKDLEDKKAAMSSSSLDENEEEEEEKDGVLVATQANEDEVLAEQLYFFSAGSDARIILWKDATAEEEARRLQEAEEVLLVEQSLSNDLRHHRYTQALCKAMKLKQPFRVLSILGAILDQLGSVSSLTVSQDLSLQGLDTILMELMHSKDKKKKASTSANDEEEEKEEEEENETDKGEKQLMQLIDYAKEWNTNAKHCFVAQALFQSLFRLMSTDQLARWPAIRENIAGLVAYTERHFQRASRLREASYLLDYVVRQMTGMLPLESLREQQQQQRHQLTSSSSEVCLSPDNVVEAVEPTVSQGEPVKVVTEEVVEKATTKGSSRKRAHAAVDTQPVVEDEPVSHKRTRGSKRK